MLKLAISLSVLYLGLTFLISHRMQRRRIASWTT